MERRGDNFGAEGVVVGRVRLDVEGLALVELVIRILFQDPCCRSSRQ
jgi:hypothetical protein